MRSTRRHSILTALAGMVIVAFALGIGASQLSRGVAAEQPTGAKPTPSAVPGLEGWIDGVVGAPVAGGKVVVGGWAADRVAGAPVSKVEVLLDGKNVGTATVGVERKDVAKTIGRDSYVRSGWNAVVDLTGVAPGPHKIGAVAYDAAGRRETLRGDQSIDVKPAQ